MSNKTIMPLPVRETGEVSKPVQRFCRLLTRLIGWRVKDWTLPDDVRKVIVIGEHHTSNLDSFLMIVMVAAMGRRLSWLVKSELNLPVIGAMIRATGGIFVDRHHPRGTVGHVIEIINARDEVFLALAPSSTRAKTDRWRTGFYHMALGSNIPVAMGYLDYATKTAGIGQVLQLSGNMEADGEAFRTFYAGVTARYPHKASDVRLIAKEALPPERKAS